MFIVLVNTAILHITSPAAILYKLTIALMAFMKYRDLVLGTLGLNLSSGVIKHVAKTIWVHKQSFIL